jgi:SH3-like domain-containing protein
MVSLRADEVNIRSGPSVRYPIKWVFQVKYMPVEVIAEYEAWRKIRDWEGSEGWVHRAMLSSRRSLITLSEITTLRRTSSDGSPAVARLSQGMVGQVRECVEAWCFIEVEGYEGWVKRSSSWGLYPNEKLQ